jgi:hypothetical protein
MHPLINIIRMIESKRMGWAGYVAWIRVKAREKRSTHSFFDRLRNFDVEWRIILKLILEEFDGDMNWILLAPNRY